MKLRTALALGGAIALTTAACSADEEGGASFSTWGEEFIEEGLPASVFADGWSVKYTKFLVTFADASLGSSAPSPAARTDASLADGAAVKAKLPGPVVVDHTKAGVKTLASFTGLPAARYGVSYRIAPAADATPIAGASAADVATMKAKGWSVLVAGTATKGAVTKTFTWGFATATRYVDCYAEVDGKSEVGAIVTAGGTDSMQLTIHGDHLFYDDLQDPAAKVRFGALASADVGANGAPGDGEITMEELAAVKLVDIPAAEGGYGVGAATSVRDLGGFVTFLSRTVGHFRGEGECRVVVE